MKRFAFQLVLLIMFFSCKNEYPVNLGKGYKLDYDGNSYDCILDTENTIMVAAHVVRYSYDSNFIVAEQKPWYDFRISGLKEMTYSKRMEAIENSTIRQYWIINKKQKSEYSLDTLSKLARYSNVFGPFKKEDYLQKREELGVPKALQLNR